MIRKDVIITMLATFCVTATLFMIVPTRSMEPYDPWADTDDNGFIDVKDILYAALRYGTLGDPTKQVIVTNWPSSINVTINHAYYANSTIYNVPASGFSGVDIPTAGFKEISLGIEYGGALTIDVYWCEGSANIEYFEQTFSHSSGHTLKVLSVHGQRLRLHLHNPNPWIIGVWIDYYITA